MKDKELKDAMISWEVENTILQMAIDYGREQMNKQYEKISCPDPETFYLDAEKPYWEDDNDYLKNNTVAKKEDENETAG
jgi:hypothetical protein